MQDMVFSFEMLRERRKEESVAREDFAPEICEPRDKEIYTPE